MKTNEYRPDAVMDYCRRALLRNGWMRKSDSLVIRQIDGVTFHLTWRGPEGAVEMESTVQTFRDAFKDFRGRIEELRPRVEPPQWPSAAAGYVVMAFLLSFALAQVLGAEAVLGVILGLAAGIGGLLVIVFVGACVAALYEGIAIWWWNRGLSKSR